ncbi:MAG: hypothetical protein ACKVTZ_04170 [Bacteroidia bacterium]
MKGELFTTYTIALFLGVMACTEKNSKVARFSAEKSQIQDTLVAEEKPQIELQDTLVAQEESSVVSTEEEEEDKIEPVVKISLSNQGYTNTFYKGNYVWAGAMNLAWNELNEKILHEKVKLKTEDSEALTMIDKLNRPVFSKKDLDEKSYYVKSGFGQETVTAIHQEMKKKFPNRSFADLTLNLAPKEIISYAYFLKELTYTTFFEKKAVQFQGKIVAGFCAKSEMQKAGIEIIKYESDDKFIIRIRLKSPNDQLFLAKGFEMNNPQSALKEINQPINTPPYLKYDEEFEAPNLHLTFQRAYNEIIGKCLANKKFEGYCMTEMLENIKFDMDEEGVRVENEAIKGAAGATKEGRDKPKPKKFILDKPYWVIMKRRGGASPYFMLGVKNVELMKEMK